MASGPFTPWQTEGEKGEAVRFVVQLLSCGQLCDSKDCSTPGFPLLYYVPEFAQVHNH